MKIRLEPKTRTGHNKIAYIQFADPNWDGSWAVTRTRDSVRFTLGKSGPWYLIEPLCDKEIRDYNIRWVHATDDDDFTVHHINAHN